jgi:putative phage-type endonuclease
MSYTYTAFPCALPAKKPGYADKALAEAWADMYVRVSARMEKLRQVALLLHEDEDKVAWALQRVFTDDEGVLIANADHELLLDVLSAEELSNKIRPLLDIIKWEPFARFPNAVAVVNCMFITNSEWVLIRCMGFGGSDSAVAMGIHKYESSSERTMAHSKMTLPNTDHDAGKAFIFAYGHQKEPLVIKTFCELSNSKQIPCPFLFRHKKWQWMTANIDAIVQLSNGKLAIFEAKTSSTFSEDEWKGGVPQHYLRQPMQYMAVLDDERIECAFIGMVTSNKLDGWYCHRIDRDIAAEEDLIKHEREFFDRYIAAGRLPDWTGESEKDLYAFFTYEKSKEVLTDGKKEALSTDTLPLLKQWASLDQKRKEAEAVLNGLEEQISLLTLQVYETLDEDSKEGFLVDGNTGYQWTIGCQVRSKTSVDKDVLKLKYPEAYKEAVKIGSTICAPKIAYKRTPKQKGGAA